jgi:AcrR family transcriptional regulator
MKTAQLNDGHLSLKAPRARLHHEKEARRQDILRSALNLFENSGYDGLGAAAIAADAGLAKGTIYLYFNTKEEIFLELVEQALLGWFEGLDEGLRRGGGGLFLEPIPPKELSALILDSLAAQPGLVRLLGILHTVLEPRADRLVALRFREFLADRTLRTGRLLEQRLPFLAEGQGASLLLQTHALVLGFGQLCDPPPHLKELMQSPGLQILDGAFRPLFKAAFLALLAGLESQAKGQPS